MKAERHPRGLLDTCVLIDLEFLDPEMLPVESTIAVVSMAELAEGVHAAKDPAERGIRMARLQSVETNLEAVPFDAAAARAYGYLVAFVVAAGQKPRPRRLDLMIAATAYANGLPLYTRNPADFQALAQAMMVVNV